MKRRENFGIRNKRVSELRFLSGMLLISLMATSYTGCPLPSHVLHQEQPISRPLKDFSHLLPTTGSREEITRTSILSLTPYEYDDLFKSTSTPYGCSQYVKGAPIRRIPLLGDVQDTQADYALFSFSIDEKWMKHKTMLQVLMSGLNELETQHLDHSIFSGLMEKQGTPADMHLLHLAGTEVDFNRCSRAYTSLLHPSENYRHQKANFDLGNDLPSPAISFHANGRPPFVGSMTDVKNLVSILEEFKLTKDSAWRKQLLVPNFERNDAIHLQDQTYLSSLKQNSLITAPLKSREKAKQKTSSKRKSKRAIGDRVPYKNNSLQACEMLLSLMMDKKRNRKSVTNSVKKAGPALPLLLTQFSASITGTGLAVMFFAIYNMACGTIPFCTSNLLTSGFGVGLFWLSLAVNKLRDTVLCITKNYMKLEFEEELMIRVDKSVNDIFFRAATLLGVLILWFA